MVVENIGFSAEDVALFRAFYKDASLRVCTEGGLSKLIFLSRSFFQVDVFSPDAANLMPVLLILMLKYSGNFYEFCDKDKDKLLNSCLRMMPL